MLGNIWDMLGNTWELLGNTWEMLGNPRLCHGVPFTRDDLEECAVGSIDREGIRLLQFWVKASSAYLGRWRKLDEPCGFGILICCHKCRNLATS